MTAPEMRKTYVRCNGDQREILIKSSNQFITQFMKYVADLCGKERLSAEKADGYLKEILHSILFIGYINFPKIEPHQILGEMVTDLEQQYPDVFKKFTSHLPLRAPYSILLDMVVQIAEEQAMDPLEELLVLNEKMYVLQDGGRRCGNDFCLASTVVSYCYFEKGNKKSKKYFGASVACTGGAKRNFFINLSCVKTWNRKVALAVCLAEKHEKSIILPETVFSLAYTVPNGRESGQKYFPSPKPACAKCLEIFPNISDETERDETEQNKKKANWTYGNCAECAAMSNLLNGEVTVDEAVKLNEDLLSTATAEEKLKPLLKPKIDNLKETLKIKMKTAEFQFFSP